MKQRVFWFVVSVLAFCDPLAAQITTLQLGTAQDGSIGMVGQSRYYRLDLASPTDLVLTVRNTSDSEDRFDVYLKRDGLPSPTDYLAASNSDSVEQLLNVPGLAAGSYYLQVRWTTAWSWWNDWGEYRILARTTGNLPRLVLGEAQEAAVPMVGQSHFYRLDLASATDLVLMVSNTSDSEDRFEVYLKRDGLPSPIDCLAAGNSDSVEQLLNVPGLAAGSYYLQVRWTTAWSWWNDWGEYRILARTTGNLPRLVLGEAQEAAVPMVGQSHFYRLDLASAADLVLTVSNSSDSEDRFEIYLKKDGLPGPTDYLAAGNLDSVEQLLNLPGLAAGSYYLQVRWTTAWSWWNDWGEYRIVCGALGFTVAQVTPQQVGNGGLATLTIGGAGLYEGATVKLTHAGQPDLLPIETAFVSQAQLRSQFDLRGVDPGLYDIVVTNPGGQTVTLSGALSIGAGGEPNLWVDIVGSRYLRPGRPEVYSIRYGNSGEVDTHDVLLRVELPPEIEVISTDLPHPDDNSIDWGSVPISFETEEARIVPVWLLRVPLGTSNGFHLTVVARGGQAHEEAMIRVQLAQADSALARSGSLDGIGDSPIFIALADAIMEVLSNKSRSSLAKSAEWSQPSREEVEEGLRRGAMFYYGWAAGGLAVGAACGYMMAGPFGAVLGAGGGALLGAFVGEALAVADAYLRLVQRIFDCAEAKLKAEYRVPGDPNEKVGPAGSGAGQFSEGNREFQYLIFFENLPTANAAAQEILIVDELDPNLDWTTFSLGELQIGDHVVSVPPGVRDFSTRVDLRPTITTLVDIACTYDPATGHAEWLLTGVDPDTGELADILPPNTEEIDPRGRGWVSYTVSPKPDLPTGTVIRNTATIDFEVGVPPEPLETPQWINTIDAGPPASHVRDLADTQSAAQFEVSWESQDDAGGSGVRDCTIYVAIDDGDYEIWLANTADTSATYTGEDGRTYRFYSRATDNVGHVEPAPNEPDAVTRVSVSHDGPPDDDGDHQPDDDGDGPPSDQDTSPSEQDAPLGPEPASCGGCGIGVPPAMVMGLGLLGLAKLRHRARHSVRTNKRKHTSG